MTTDTTVIQPGVGQSILTTDHRDHGGHRGDHDSLRGFRELRTDADYRALTQQVERFGTMNGDRITSGTQVTGDRINTVGAAAALAAGHTNELVQGTSCTTDRLVGAGFKDVHDRLCDGFGNVTAAVAHGSEESQENYAALQKQISDAATSTVVGFKESQGLAFQVEGRALLEAAKNANAASVQATANANAASVEAAKNFYALTVEAVKNASAAELRAQQIAATAAAKAAECCCELKELIRAEAGTTRALITDNRMRDLEQRLNRIPVGVAITIPPGL